MRVFTEEQIREAVSLGHDVLEVIEEGFNELQQGNVLMPPVLSMNIEEHKGEMDVKTAYVRGKDIFALKVSTGFFENDQRGLPSGSGLMVLINSETGVPAAVLQDNGYLTDIRTAAAGAISAKYLARKHPGKVGVIGAGKQALFQIRALTLVRDFETLYVYAPTKKRIDSFVRQMEQELQGVHILPVNDPETLVRQSNLVISCTPATEPIIYADWLHPGLHITALGADTSTKQELDPHVLQQADHVVCDDRLQCFELGELHHALQAGIFRRDEHITQLGDITNQLKQGRMNDNQVTVCDLTGTGVQDTAIADYSLKKLQELWG